MKIVSIVVAAIILAGCAAPKHLNDPARSALAIDPANLLKTREIPFETQSSNGIEVSYNLMSFRDSDFAYRLTLKIKNLSVEPVTIYPRISVVDADNAEIEPWHYRTFMAKASAMAGTPIPDAPRVQTPQTTYSTGTITNAYGNTYNYSGTSYSAPSGGFAAGLAQGLAQGARNNAIADQRNGNLMTNWANTFWIKDSYQVNPYETVVGALPFPSVRNHKLPITVLVSVNGTTFEFKTSDK